MEDDRETIIDIKERLVRIETMLEQQLKTDTLERQVIEEKIKLLEEQLKVANHRISDIETHQNWLRNTIIGAIIAGAIGFFFKFK